MRVEPLFKWYDFWIGFFWDRSYKRLYFFPIPMIGLCFHFKPRYFEWGVQAYNGGSPQKLSDRLNHKEKEDWVAGWKSERDRTEILN